MLSMLTHLARFPRALIWRWCVIPLLGCMLVYQYASWVGLQDLAAIFHLSCGSSSGPQLAPAPAPTHHASATAHSPQPGLLLLSTLRGARHALLGWLGARDVTTVALWALAAALGCCVMQAQTDAHTVLAAASEGSGPRHGPRWGLGWLGGKGGGRARGGQGEGGDLEAPLLGEQQQQQQVQHARAHLPPLPPLFAPLDFAHQPDWGWLDWGRYLAIKHSIDVLLVCGG